MVIDKFTAYILLSFAALFTIGYKVVSPHEGNFYRSIVALTISRWFTVALTNAGLAFLLACFWITVRIFFQKLHPLENSNLQEKFFIFAAEGVLGIAMVRGAVTPTDGAMFLITCTMSMLHAVLVKRMNMLEEAAMTTTKRRVMSVSILTAWLFVIDASVCLWLASMIWGNSSSSSKSSSTMNIGGRTVQIGLDTADDMPAFGRSAGIVLLLLLDWSLNIVQCITATTKLALMACAARFPSEVTNSVRFYVEIVTEIFKSCIYIGFGGLLLQQSTMPLHLVREILTNFKRIAVLAKDFVQHRKRMKWIEQVELPTEQQLAEDCFCNICRDEVVNPELARMLPCSHLFHVDCLAKWLERNRDCPYCQRDVEQMINQYVAAKKRQQNGGETSSPQQQQQEGQQQQQPVPNPAVVEQNNAHAAAQALADLFRRHNNLNNNQNQNQQQQQQQTNFQREVRLDAQTGRIADESALREMYEQYRAVALKRKEQERQLAETAIALSKLAAESNNNSNSDEKNSTSSSSEQQQNANSKVKPTFLTRKINTTEKSKNSNDDDDENENDNTREYVDVYSFSVDSDDEFVVAPSASSSSVNNNNNKNLSAAELKIAAYERYERNIERAKRKLQRELADIEKSNNSERKSSTIKAPPPSLAASVKTPMNANTMLVSSSSSMAPPPASSASKSEEENANNNSNNNNNKGVPLVFTPYESMNNVKSPFSPLNSNTNNNNGTDEQREIETISPTTAMAAAVAAAAAEREREKEKEKEKEEQKEQQEETKKTDEEENTKTTTTSDNLAAPTDEQPPRKRTPLNLSAYSETGDGEDEDDTTTATTNTGTTTAPLAVTPPVEKEDLQPSQEQQNTNDSSEEQVANPTTPPAQQDQQQKTSSSAMMMESNSSSSSQMLMTENSREESASDSIRRQAQERYLQRKKQQQEEERLQLKKKEEGEEGEKSE